MSGEDMGNVGFRRDDDVVMVLVNIESIEVLEETKVVEGSRGSPGSWMCLPIRS